MKVGFFILLILIGMTACGSGDSIFELDPQQSMLMTGKGPGQDGAMNPYSGQKSIAVVSNLGNSVFSARIQKNGEILEEIDVPPGVTKNIPLEPTYELYLDSEEKSKSKVTFKKFKE